MISSRPMNLRSLAKGTVEEGATILGFLANSAIAHSQSTAMRGIKVGVGSHSHHVYSAHDLCEPRVHTVGAAAANRRIKHPSINNAYVSQRSDIRAR